MTSAAKGERAARFPMTDPQLERPVFVAADDRRARLVRYGGGAAILLACLWLVALAIGMLGIGRLPDVSLPSIVRGADHSRSEKPRAKVEASSPVVSAGAVASDRGSRSSTRVDAARAPARQTSGTRPNAPTHASRAARTRDVRDATPPAQGVRTPVAPPTPAPAAAPAAPAPVPAAPTQGWARQGYTAPPGQTRQTEPKAAPATPGQTRRAEAQAAAPAPAPATTTPEPPGQQKKTEEPKPKG